MIYKDKIYTEIHGFKDYFISKEGQVISIKPGRNVKTGSVKMLKPVVNSKGYNQYYMIANTGKKLSPMQHQLLMRTFVENPDNYPYINHINGVKTDNRLSNLEWCTAAENSQHAVDTGLLTSDHCTKETHVYALTGEYIQSFKSLKAAEIATGASSPAIVKNIQGKTKHSSGLLFSYEKKEHITPYNGAPILKEIVVTNMETSEITILPSIEATVKLIGMHRASIIRRFKKDLTFYFGVYKVTKTTY